MSNPPYGFEEAWKKMTNAQRRENFLSAFGRYWAACPEASFADAMNYFLSAVVCKHGWAFDEKNVQRWCYELNYSSSPLKSACCVRQQKNYNPEYSILGELLYDTKQYIPSERTAYEEVFLHKPSRKKRKE